MEPGDPGKRMQFNPGPLQLVTGRIGGGGGSQWRPYGRPLLPRRAWSDAEIRAVLDADADTVTVDELADRLNRSPVAVAKRRLLIIRLLRGDGDWAARAAAWRADPRNGHGDVAAVDRVIRAAGWYDRPVGEQFAHARPLRRR